jgi:uncharacterized membrane protein HdeD (DUF308 family)
MSEHQHPHLWWSMALRGIFAILFGILAFTLPVLTFRVLVIFFGAFVLVDGIWAVIHGISQHWYSLFEGLIGIAVGALTFIWPGITALSLLYLIAVWAISTGVLEIVNAIRLCKEIDNEWLMGFSGILSIIFGALVAFFPWPAVLAIIWIIGAYALVFGGLVLRLALKFRRHANPEG